MDQIGKLYQNRAMVLQQEVNRLEKLLEAVVQDPRPFTPAQQKIRDDFKKQENPTSQGRTVPPTPEDTGFQSTPNVKFRDPLQSDPAVQNAFSKYLENSGVSRVASSIQNISDLPRDSYNAVYNTSPWMTTAGIGAGAVYTGVPRTFVNPITNFAKGFLTRYNLYPERPGPFEPSTKGVGGYNRVKPTPMTVVPTAAKPSSLAGKFDLPEFSDLFEPNPAKTKTGVLKAVGSDVLAALKPGGFYSAIERHQARTRNDEIVKRWTEVTKPTGVSNVRADNVVKGKVGVTDAQTILDNSTDELNALRQIQSPNPIESALIASKEKEVAGDTAVRNTQSSNLKRLKTIAGDAKTAAKSSSAAYSAATQSKVPLLDFDWKAFAKDRLKPTAIAGLRNLATGGVGLVGDLVVGGALEAGLKQIPYVKDQDTLVDVVARSGGGAAGGAIVTGLAGLGGAAIGSAAVAGGLVAGTGALAYGVGKKVAELTPLEDQISGMSAIRKTPGMTRGELEAKHPSTDPDLDDKTKAEYAQAAADYIRRQAEKSGKTVQARSMDTTRVFKQ
jgi:hypothetical protein